ncbi:MAG TPA: lactonase family protein [Terriglobia bacterium]|nr:lactonase family protein [Terriglobia bacterium]
MRIAAIRDYLIWGEILVGMMTWGLLSLAAEETKVGSGGTLVYIGTYTGLGSQGIYAYRLYASSGALTPIGLAAETPNPSFLAVHPGRRFLYAVNEVDHFDGRKSGAVTAFEIDAATGKLSLLNQQASGGRGPCYLSVDRTGKYVLLANYGGGSVSVLPIETNGSLGKATAFIQHSGKGSDPQRQEGPHAHSINLDAANRFAVAADLGLDKLLVYRFDATKGTLSPNDPPYTSLRPKSGPRHFAFHPQGKFAYVINEMASTITAFSYDAEHGVLKELQTVTTLPNGFSGENSTAEVQVHPSGKFLYGSNRGHDSIAVFKINGEKGTLQLIEIQPTRGKEPRNFGIDPSGSFLLAANQNSGNIVVFRIDSKTGRLSATGNSVDVNSPVCVKFVEIVKSGS